MDAPNGLGQYCREDLHLAAARKNVGALGFAFSRAGGFSQYLGLLLEQLGLNPLMTALK
jgi:hypothetical protein